MTTVQIAASIVTLAALLAWINNRWVRLPPQIGMLAFALAGSIALVGLDALGVIDASRIERVVGEVDFARTVVHGMLGLLLFAGALGIPVDQLREQRWPIAALSIGGTIASTALVGGAIYALLGALGRPIAATDAFVFGAVISPTDPVAVLGVLKRAKLPPQLAVQISGESLFNDGVGVVLFTVLLGLAAGHHATVGDAVFLFAREAIGGAVFGLVGGLVCVRMLRAVDDGTVEVLLTLALVLGGGAAAEALGISAPIAAVVAGIIVGNRSSHDARGHHLDMFWELVDELLNAVLFLALGLEATRLRVSVELAIAAAVAVPVVLAARAVSVGASLALLRPFGRSESSLRTVAILTWGGLRGGLSVALALSLPRGDTRDVILVMTYAIVAIAVLVQGLTLGTLLRKLGLGGTHEPG